MKPTLDEVREQTERGLDELLSAQGAPSESLRDIMRYSALGGGKRVRAFLAYAFYLACGGDDPRRVSYYACALEMVHAASLIHDDLPCMDNDDMRRGKPSCHKAYGEAGALLAGDALFIKAFETVAANPLCTAAQNAEAVAFLARAAGPDGMCAGQMIDLENEGRRVSLPLLRELDSLKTSCLIRAACALGCIAAGASGSLKDAAGEYAEQLGIAFQIRDDIFDYGQGEIGKPVGIDLKEQKITLPLIGAMNSASPERQEQIRQMVRQIPEHPEYCDELQQFARSHGGIEYATRRLDDYIEEAVSALALFPDSKEKEVLAGLARYNAVRNK